MRSANCLNGSEQRAWETHAIQIGLDKWRGRCDLKPVMRAKNAQDGKDSEAGVILVEGDRESSGLSGSLIVSGSSRPQITGV